jgi:VanZ family protein
LAAAKVVSLRHVTLETPSPVSKRAWLWPCLLAAAIFAASSRSQIAGAGAFPGIDKVVHFLIYGLLATLTVRIRPGRGFAILAVLAASLFGVSDEWHQSFTPGRSVELADWAADTSGAALAVFLYVRWSRYRRCLEWTMRRNRRVEKVVPVAPVSSP